MYTIYNVRVSRPFVVQVYWMRLSATSCLPTVEYTCHWLIRSTHATRSYLISPQEGGGSLLKVCYDSTAYNDVLKLHRLADYCDNLSIQQRAALVICWTRSRVHLSAIFMEPWFIPILTYAKRYKCLGQIEHDNPDLCRSLVDIFKYDSWL